MTRLTQDQVHQVSREAWEKQKNPIIECKNAVTPTDLTGLAWCEDLNEKYINFGPMDSLQGEINKCLETRYCDPSYILEKMRLLTCHIADLYRMTAFEEPYKSVCAEYRNEKHYKSGRGCGSGCRGEGDKDDNTMYRLRPRKQLRAALVRTPPNEGSR